MPRRAPVPPLLLLLLALHALNWTVFYGVSIALEWDKVSVEAEALVNMTRTPVFVTDVVTEYWTRALPVIILLSLMLTGSSLPTKGESQLFHRATWDLVLAILVDVVATVVQKVLYNVLLTECRPDLPPPGDADCQNKRTSKAILVGVVLFVLWGISIVMDLRAKQTVERADQVRGAAVAALAAAPRFGQHVVSTFSGAVLVVVGAVHKGLCEQDLQCSDADRAAVFCTILLVTVALLVVVNVDPDRITFDTTWNQLAIFPIVVALWTADRAAYVTLTAPAEAVCGFTGSVLLVVCVLTSAEQTLGELPRTPAKPAPRNIVNYKDAAL